MELTIEQQKALALARARRRRQGSQEDPRYSGGIYDMLPEGLGNVLKGISHSADGVGAGLLMGFDDEAQAALSTLGGGDYSENQKKFDAQKTKRREESPVASIAGELAGGLVAGGTLAKGGVTLAGKSLPVAGKTGAAATEGAIYGGLTGAGEAAQGERLEGGAKGALFGAGTGTILHQAGRLFGKKNVANQMAQDTPTVQAMRQAENETFEAARNSGVMVKPQATNRLVANMTLAAGRLNPNLRQKTAGIIEDIAELKGKPLDVQDVHELRQTVQRALMDADSSDAGALKQVLKVVDNFIDRADDTVVAGGREGLDILRKALGQSAKRFKAERIARLLDLADVKTGQYTQSGMMNTIRSEANTLYRQIIDGRVKGFTPAETQIIRQLAKTDSVSGVTKWLSKLAPRGVMSLVGGPGLFGAAGTVLGTAIGGPAGGIVGGTVGVGIPAAAGAIAARTADKTANKVANDLLGSISREAGYQVPKLINKSVPFIGGSAAGTSQLFSR